MTERKHKHWGSIAREANPRIVIDTATARRGGWATLVISVPPTSPYKDLRPIVSPSRETARATHDKTEQWVRGLASAVVCDPEVCHGRPTIRGTRVWVDCVFAYLTKDGTLDWPAFHSDYPSVTREQAVAIASLPGHVRRTLADLCS